MADKSSEVSKNPWVVTYLEEFLFYCCPECDVKCQSKDFFLHHALGNHPLAADCLKQFQNELEDGSYYLPNNVEVEVKQETDNEELLDDFDDYEDSEDKDFKPPKRKKMV